MKQWKQGSAHTALCGFAAVAVVLGGCQRDHTKVVTAADVEAAQAQAQHEMDQARAEAKKDVKSAAKTAGVDSRNVAIARVTGSYDIAMAHADGDHNVALAKCLTLAPSAQQACKIQADADFQAAAATAKATRVAQQR